MDAGDRRLSGPPYWTYVRGSGSTDGSTTGGRHAQDPVDQPLASGLVDHPQVGGWRIGRLLPTCATASIQGVAWRSPSPVRWPG